MSPPLHSSPASDRRSGSQEEGLPQARGGPLSVERRAVPVPAREWPAWVALAFVLAMAGRMVWRPVAPGVWHDDGVYLLLARALAEGEGYAYDGVPGAPPAAKFPPGYPLILAGLWRLAGGELDGTVRLAALLNLVGVVATGVGLAWLARRRFAFTMLGALGVGAAWGLVAAPWRFAHLALSESLTIPVMVLGVAWAGRLEAKPRNGSSGEEGAPGPRRGHDLLLLASPLLAFGVAIHLRSAALPLGVALAIAALVAGGVRRGAWVAAAAAAVAFPWLLFSSRWNARIPVVFRDILGSYDGLLLRGLATDPVGYLAARVLAAGEVLRGIAAMVVPWLPPGGDGAVVPALTLLLIATGTLFLWRRSYVAAVLLVALLGQMVLWPHQESRLLLPILPWVILAGALCLQAIGSGRPLPFAGFSILAGAVWMAGAAVALAAAVRGPPGLAGEDLRVREGMALAAAAAVRDHVPPGVVVGAPDLWAILHLRTGHPVVPGAPFRPGEVLPAGTVGEQHRLWVVGRVGALVAEGRTLDQALTALADRCGPDALAVRAGGPGFRLVELRWDEDCRRALVPGWGGGKP